MKGNKLPKGLGIILLGWMFFLSLPVSAGLIDDMVLLDRDYIPALALTNQPDKPEMQVKEAFSRLEKAWEQFQKSLSKADRETPVLQTALKEAEKNIQEAKKMLARGKRHDAHEALEGLRTGFWKARSTMGIDYLPDHLTAFHDPMEGFYDKAVAIKQSGGDPSSLKPLLSHLSTLWSEVEKRNLDRRLFGFNEEKASNYEDMVKQEGKILVQLSQLLASGNQEALVKTAGSLKGNFARLYLLFGNFSGL
ncbi:MAG: hypothetical protein AB1585_08865 [Thermodesulfobacteriota bacterium]